MYLSRLLLNPQRLEVQRDLADCHALHRTLLRAFPSLESGGSSPRDQFGVLYRVDQSAQLPGRISVLVQSRVEPQWNHLPEYYLLATAGVTENPSCKPVDHLHELITGGLRLRFRLRANPTKKVSVTLVNGERRHNGTRVEITDEKALLAWLERKGQQHGFVLGQSQEDGGTNVRILCESKAKGQRRADVVASANQKLTFGSVLFDGILQVTNVELFRDALIEGIGSAKAYGFGLLSVARVPGLEQ